MPVSLSVLFSACGSLGLQKGSSDGPPERLLTANEIKDIVPKAEPLSRYGNPKSYVTDGKRYYVMQSAAGYVKRGTASWYGSKFHGKRTASGEIYDMYAMSAAHKTLPIPSYVKVTNLDNQRSAIVRVNDRGPFYGDRLIDLSYAAAVKLDIKGTAPVEIRTVSFESSIPTSQPDPAAQQSHGSYIQVGAFADRQNAERLQKRISFYTSLPVTISQGGANNPYYRVRVGPFSDREAVNAATTHLSNLGFSDTIVFSD